MKSLIFADYGIEIFLDGALYTIRYDAGQIAVKIVEVPAAHADVEKAMRSERDAYEVLLRIGVT